MKGANEQKKEASTRGGKGWTGIVVSVQGESFRGERREERKGSVGRLRHQTEGHLQGKGRGLRRAVSRTLA